MHKLASDYRANATQCREIAQFLKSPLATMYWQSQAATNFRDQISQYTRVLNEFEAAFKNLSQDVDARAATLEQTHNV
jgi:uncharacterized protein YukE